MYTSFISLNFNPFSIHFKGKDEMNQGIKDDELKEILKNGMKEIPYRGYCINLDRRPERWQRFKTLSPSELKIERFSAIDAKDWRKGFLGEPLDYIESKMKFPCNSGGEITGSTACFLSHYRIWKNILNDKTIKEDELIFIFEDDADFVDNWYSLFKEYISGLKELKIIPNLLYLGGRFTASFTPSPEGLESRFIKITDHIYQFKDNKGSYETDRTTHSYIISKKGIRNLMGMVALSVNENKMGFYTIDCFMDAKHADLELMDLNPHLCWSPAAHVSDVQGTTYEFYTGLCSKSIYKLSK